VVWFGWVMSEKIHCSEVGSHDWEHSRIYGHCICGKFSASCKDRTSEWFLMWLVCWPLVGMKGTRAMQSAVGLHRSEGVPVNEIAVYYRRNGLPVIIGCLELTEWELKGVDIRFCVTAETDGGASLDTTIRERPKRLSGAARRKRKKEKQRQSCSTAEGSTGGTASTSTQHIVLRGVILLCLTAVIAEILEKFWGIY